MSRREIGDLPEHLRWLALAYAANGDEVEITDEGLVISFGPNRHNVDGPAVVWGGPVDDCDHCG